MRQIAISGKGSNLCLRLGFLPVPVHFYSPIPDLEDLNTRQVWSKKSSLSGIQFNANQQLEFLRELGTRFGNECNWPDTEQSGHPELFFTQNQSFSFGCAASTYCMIRHAKPRRVIEIGSGMSTRVIAQALAANALESKSESPRQYAIDPYPSRAVQKILDPEHLMIQTVERIDLDFFSHLEKNDILFIDSSHSVRIGSDVNFLLLDVIPCLKDGVIVHFHDISLPYDYAKVYATSETFRQFWTEQYLLQAFLCHNKDFEVLLAMNWIMEEHKDNFTQSFLHYDASRHPHNSGSFWIRRVR